MLFIKCSKLCCLYSLVEEFVLYQHSNTHIDFAIWACSSVEERISDKDEAEGPIPSMPTYKVEVGRGNDKVCSKNSY